MESTQNSNVQLLNALKALQQGNLAVRLPDGQTGTDQEIAETFNRLADQLSQLVGELNRLMLEMANEGKLGGQREVDGLSGAWKDVQDHVNQMEYVFTLNLRNMAETAARVVYEGEPTRGRVFGSNEVIGLGLLIHSLARVAAQGQPTA